MLYCMWRRCEGPIACAKGKNMQHSFDEIAKNIAKEIADYFGKEFLIMTDDPDYKYFISKKSDVYIGGREWVVSLSIADRNIIVYLYRNDIWIEISNIVKLDVFPFECICSSKFLQGWELQHWLDRNYQFAKLFRFVQESRNKYFNKES